MFEVKMPQWGMEMTEGTIVDWLVAEGDRVKKGDPIVEIELAKTNGTIEAPCSGVMAKLIAQVDETIPIYGLLALIDDSR